MTTFKRMDAHTLVFYLGIFYFEPTRTLDLPLESEKLEGARVRPKNSRDIGTGVGAGDRKLWFCCKEISENLRAGLYALTVKSVHNLEPLGLLAGYVRLPKGVVTLYSLRLP